MGLVSFCPRHTLSHLISCTLSYASLAGASAACRAEPLYLDTGIRYYHVAARGQRPHNHLKRSTKPEVNDASTLGMTEPT